MSGEDDGPKSELARYAFGWSDKKPSWTYWAILAVIVAFDLASCVQVVKP